VGRDMGAGGRGSRERDGRTGRGKSDIKGGGSTALFSGRIGGVQVNAGTGGRGGHATRLQPVTFILSQAHQTSKLKNYRACFHHNIIIK